MRRADRWLRVVLGLEAFLVLVAFFAVLAAQDEQPVSGWIAALLLPALPLLGVPAQRVIERNPRLPNLTMGLVWALLLVPLRFLHLETLGPLLPALLVFLQSLLLLRARGDTAAAACIALGPVQVVACLALAPAEGWLLFFPVVLVLAACGLLLHQARTAERRLGALEGSVPAGSLARLALVALPLTALLLLAVPLLSLVLLLLPDPVLDAPAPGSADPVAQADTGEGVETPGQADRREAFEQIFPSSVDLGGGVTQLEHQTVMRLWARTPIAAPLYLRGMVLDRFDAAGAGYGGGARSTTRGPVDGWTPLSDVDPRGAALDVVEILQQPIFLQREDAGILFTPSETVAIDRGPVRYDPDGFLSIPGAPRPLDASDPSQWFRTTCRVVDRRFFAVEVGDAPARHPSGGMTQLPRGREVSELRRIARLWTVDAETDRERVERIVGTFQRDFRYSLRTTEFPGLPGVLAFLAAREGSCTAYASACTLLLRTLGIPARIATGFLAKEFDPDEGCYVVTTREGHAWVEVHFEGIGWVTYDPTPAEERDALLAAALRPEPGSGVAAWTGEILFELRRWAASGGDAGPARALAATVAEAPRALWNSARRSPVVFALLVGVAVLLLFGLRWRRSAGLEAGAPPHGAGAGDPALDSLYRRVVRALGRLGYEKRASQTGREFAHAVLAAPGAVDGLAPLGPITETFYRARFGGLPLSPEETGRVEEFLARLEELHLRGEETP